MATHETKLGSSVQRVDGGCPLCGQQVAQSGLNRHFSEQHPDAIPQPSWADADLAKRKGPRWRWVRQRILERDDQECQHCGAGSEQRNLEVHHIVPFNEFAAASRAHAPRNLIAVCVPCHRLLEQLDPLEQLRSIGPASPTGDMTMEEVLLAPGRAKGRTASEKESERGSTNRRGKEGTFSDKYTDGAFYNAVIEYTPVATTREVADAVGCSKRTALARLDELEDQGAVASKLVGRTRIWYLPENHD